VDNPKDVGNKEMEIEKMKLTFLPKTRLGIWSLVLTAASWILFIAGSLLPSKAGYSGLEIVNQNPLQAIATVLILAAGITAPIMGLIAVIKKQERSILVFLVIPTILTNIFMGIGVIMNVFFGKII